MPVRASNYFSRRVFTPVRAWLRRLFARPPVPKCDVLLFVTTRSECEELKAVTAKLGLVCRDRIGRPPGNYFDLGLVGDHRVLAVHTAMGSILERGSTSQAVLFQSLTEARALIAVGMAYGISRKFQGFGDVLVSERIFPYDDREVLDSTAGPPFSSYKKTRSKKPHPELLRMFHRAAKRGQYNFAVTFGTMLSGGARISSATFRDQLAASVTGVEPVIGGDMEGVGLLAVSGRWIVVKGVSDFAEGPSSQTNDAQRAAACRNAINLVLSALLYDHFDAIR